MKKSMIEAIKDYFIENVTLAEDFKNILVDFLGEDAVDYTIELIPIEETLRSYVDGGYLGQLTFNFGSREFYDDSKAQNIENLDFYEKFKNQIEENNKRHILPDIDGIQSIECLNNGTVDGIQKGTAKYVIQMRITYIKDYNSNNEISL